MKKIILIISTLFLISACQSSEPPETINETGVHLQATFNLPEELEGAPPSHDHMDYLLYLPEGYYDEPDKEWPLIFFCMAQAAQKTILPL